MTQTQKDDWKMAIAFGFCLVAASFIMGVFDGLDKAIEAQAESNRHSVYCQQVGAQEVFCPELLEHLTKGD